MSLVLRNLQCRSLEAQPGVVVHDFEIDGAPRRIFEARDVLYLAEVHTAVVEDFVPEEAILYPAHLDEYRPKFRNTVIDRARVRKFDVEACILGNAYYNVFYHWIDELIKVVQMEAWGFRGPYIVPKGYPALCRQAFEILGLDPRRLMPAEGAIRLETVYFPAATPITRIAQHREVLDLLRQGLIPKDAADQPPVAVWLHRGEGLKRRVVNQADLDPILERHGFLKVDMGTLSLAEQIALSSRASIIAGPSGSAFTHSLFMPTGGSVIEVFSPHYVNPCLLSVCKALDHSYHGVVARCWPNTPYPYGLDVMVDLEHLELCLPRIP